MKKFIKVDGNIGYLEMISRKYSYYGMANGPWGWWGGLDSTSPYRARIGGEGVEKEWVNGQRQRRPGEKEEEDRIAAREIEEFLLENDRVPPRERSRDREEREEEEEEERAREEREKEKKEWRETERERKEKRRKGLSESYTWDWSFLDKK